MRGAHRGTGTPARRKSKRSSRTRTSTASRPSSGCRNCSSCRRNCAVICRRAKRRGSPQASASTPSLRLGTTDRATFRTRTAKSRTAAATLCGLLGPRTHGYHCRSHGAPGLGHRPRAPPSHRGVIARHDVRVVRLLPLRLARRDHRQAVLHRRQRNDWLHLRAAGIRRGLRSPAVRRADLRQARRPRRPQAHVPDHDRHHGRRHGARRRAADAGVDRRGGADHSHHVATCCKVSPSAASTAALRPTSRSTHRRVGARTTRAGFRSRRLRA